MKPLIRLPFLTCTDVKTLNQGVVEITRESFLASYVNSNDFDGSSFVPGQVCCAYCGYKPEDRWDPAPNGFVRRYFKRNDDTTFAEYRCDECDYEVNHGS